MERDLKIDNIKGVLITLVVIGHFLLPFESLEIKFISNIFYTIYAFHMPCFIFVSGFLAKSIRKDGRFRWEKIFNVAWLYILFKILVFFSEIPAYGKSSDYPDFLRETGAPWYLLALVIWYFGLFFLSRIKTSWGKALTMLLIVILGLWGGNLDQYVPAVSDILALDRVLAFAPFFYGGYFLSEENYRRFFYWRSPGDGTSKAKSTGTEFSGNQSKAGTQMDGDTSENGSRSRKRQKSRQRNSGNSREFRDTIIEIGVAAFKLLLFLAGIYCAYLCLFHMRELFWNYRLTFYGVWYSNYWFWVLPEVISVYPWLPRLVNYLMAVSMSYALFLLTPGRKTIFGELGKRSLQIFILHRPIRDLLLAGGYYNYFQPESKKQILLLILSAVLCTFVLALPVFTLILNWFQSLPARVYRLIRNSMPFQKPAS